MDDADTWRGATDLARRLVRIDTRGGREAPAAALVADRLDDAGFDVRVEEPIPGRANVIARSGPRYHGCRSPSPDTWTRCPPTRRAGRSTR